PAALPGSFVTIIIIARSLPPPRCCSTRQGGPAMAKSKKPHATGKTKPGDVSERVGVEQIRSRGVNVEQLLEKLIDAAGAEFTTYYYYTLLRMYLAGHEDY